MTKLDIIKKNKAQYSELESKIQTLTGIEKAVASTLTLAWIKGEKWMGGLSDRKFDSIAESLIKDGYDVDAVMDEFQRQIELIK